MITSWSHSRLGDFEKCKHMAWLKYEKRIPEPDRPLPLGKTEHANNRGSRIHDGLEAYVSGQSSYLPIEVEKHFGPQVDLLRALYAEGCVSLEGEWGMDKDWEIAAWEIAWLRLKLDVAVFLDDKCAIVVDYKSGRKYGNEIKHGEQLQLYQLVTFIRYPMLEHVTAELWYLDIGDTTSMTFTRSQGLRFKKSFQTRGHALTSCEEFPTNASRFTCKWCPYLNTEHCSVGVKL